MHETSIAQQVLHTVACQAKQHALHSVDRIQLKIGVLASIDSEALRFALQCGLSAYDLANVQIEIGMEAAHAECSACKQRFPLETLYDPCPSCGSFRHQILTGTSMTLQAIEGSNTPTPAHPSSIPLPVSM